MAASIRLYKRAVSSSTENAIIESTESAALQGVTVLTENYNILSKRYTDEPRGTTEYFKQASTKDRSLNRFPSVQKFTRDEIQEEISAQDGNKSCGSDGVHIRFLKILLRDTCLIDWL